MRRAILSQVIRALSLLKIAAIWLLALAGAAQAGDPSFDVIVTATSTHVMAGEKPIGEVQKDTRLTVSQTNGDWYLIGLPNTNPPQQGWIRKGDVRLSPAAPAARQLTPDQQEQLKRRDELDRETNQLRNAGKIDEAIAAAEKMLAIERTVLGSDSGDALGSLDELARLHELKDDFVVARKLRQEVLTTKAKHLGKDHWQVVDARLALEQTSLLEKLSSEQRGQLQQAERLMEASEKLYGAGHFPDALESAERALDIRRNILGERHPLCAVSLCMIGDIYQQMGNFAAGERPFRQALAITKETRGENNPNYANISNDLAMLYYNLGDYTNALPLCKQAMEIRKQTLGSESAEYGSSMSFLATLDTDMGDYDKAEPLYRHSLAIKKQVLGERNMSYVIGLDNLARLYTRMGDYSDALPLSKQALEIEKTLLNPRSPDYAVSLANLAETYLSIAEFSESESLFKQALEIQRQMRGEKHPDYAATLNNLANLYSATGDYAKAESLIKQALAIRKQSLGEKHPDYAANLVSLARLYERLGEYRKAEALLLQSLQIREEVLGEKHPDYADTLDDLASVYRSMGDYAKAESLFLRAVKLRKDSRRVRTASYATGLQSLATLYQDMGDYAKAGPLFDESLEIERAVLGEKHPNYATTLNDRAGLYLRMGDYGAAKPLYEQALDIEKHSLGEKHPDYAGSLGNLASLYMDMGNFAKAEPLYRQAMEITKEALGEQHPDFAKRLNDIAFLSISMGDYAKAEPLLRQAIQIDKAALGEINPDYANRLHNLASLYDAMGSFAKAVPLYKQTLAIEKQVLGEKHPDYANSLNNLALLYQKTGDYASAEPLYEQAIKIRKQTLGEKHPDYAISLNNLALLDQKRGDFANAESLFRQALEIERQALGEKHPDYGVVLSNLALLYSDLNDDARAEPLARQSLQISREWLDRTAAVQSERQQLRMAEVVRARLNIYVSLAHNASLPAEPVYAEVLAWKGAVTARQQAMRQLRRGQENPQAAELYRQLADTARQLDSASRATPEPGQAESHRQQLEQLSDALETLEKQLATASAAFQQQLSQRRLTPDDLRRVLPSETALVDLLEYQTTKAQTKPEAKPGQQELESRLVAFVVRPDQPVESIYLGLLDPIAADIADWRKNFGTVRAGAADPGADLRRLVWDKLQPRLQGAKTVLISPDGVTAQFPWPALPGEKPGTYLIDDVAIAIVPVPRMLPELLSRTATRSGNQPRTAPSLLLVGDVDFGAAPGELLPDSSSTNLLAARGGRSFHWQSLPGTRDEVAAIMATFQKQFGGAASAEADELTGARATKSAVRQAAGRHQFIHFSTHGFFAPPELKSALDAGLSANNKTTFAESTSFQNLSGLNPDLLSGLVLAGANRPVEHGQDDGILSALEVSEMDLSHVELATLSACETGLGQSAGGEGLLGLQRAFQLAGAKTTLASLWQVPDRATQSLMSRFYQNLWQRRMSKLEALREAQQWLIREGPKKPELLRGRGLDLDSEPDKEVTQSGGLSPRYWAAFELSGDWR
ncbi:MAG TPA: tetratricopeptide repeat protein [Pirellulales bacterium]|nr:tetratricopeptide repeat protein [Pirellulales bacterium]